MSHLTLSPFVLSPLVVCPTLTGLTCVLLIFPSFCIKVYVFQSSFASLSCSMCAFGPAFCCDFLFFWLWPFAWCLPVSLSLPNNKLHWTEPAKPAESALGSKPLSSTTVTPQTNEHMTFPFPFPFFMHFQFPSILEMRFQLSWSLVGVQPWRIKGHEERRNVKSRRFWLKEVEDPCACVSVGSQAERQRLWIWMKKLWSHISQMFLLQQNRCINKKKSTHTHIHCLHPTEL